MSIASAADIVHIWEESGHPVRLGWRGRRYRVLAARPVRSRAVTDALTHPADYLIGWTLAAHPEDDASAILSMNVRRSAASWMLLDVVPA